MFPPAAKTDGTAVHKMVFTRLEEQKLLVLNLMSAFTCISCVVKGADSFYAHITKLVDSLSLFLKIYYEIIIMKYCLYLCKNASVYTYDEKILCQLRCVSGPFRTFRYSQKRKL